MDYVLAPLSRRGLLGGALAAGAAGLAPAAYAESADPRAQAEAAAIWGFPLVLNGRYLQLSQNAGIGFNELHLNQDLATPSLHVAGPNVDTIYGIAWLDLAREPVVISVPDAGDRYYSIHLLDAFGNSFAYIGRRETGTRAGAYAITAPGWRGRLPDGVQAIAAPTALVLVFTRTLVKGSADLAAAQQLQARYALGPLSQHPNGLRTGIVSRDALNVLPALDLSDAGAGYFDELNDLVRRYRPSGLDGERLAGFDALGLGARRPAFKRRLSEAELAGVWQSALSRIRAVNNSEVQNGWRVNFNITQFIADPLARAANNAYGPGAHIAEEALYFSARTGANGARLNGAQPQRLRFPPGRLPPVDAFWSLILYDENFWLFDNPLNRYAIHDRTDNLAYDADGGLTVIISAQQPQGGGNWLPAPAGPYQLILRTYQPRAEILDRSYQVPALETL